MNHDLCYKKSDERLKLVAYSDADWASDQTDRCSTTGYRFSLSKNGSAISLKTKKQQTVALSTCEAEYIALAATAQEFVPAECYVPVKIFGDNQGAITLTKNPVCCQRSKHIDIKYHFIRSVLSDEHNH